MCNILFPGPNIFGVRKLFFFGVRATIEKYFAIFL
uniref:Uncharacterized protein n=1 Tax=Marseillevirus sp. TaxID=2809551 RepID=A0AA96ELX8_9VIRU|nr:hypothetical protein MarDSR_068 [Marseillevirus sp.]